MGSTFNLLDSLLGQPENIVPPPEEEESSFESILKGRLIRMNPNLTSPTARRLEEETFDDFFRKRAPARAILGDALLAATASTFGGKHVSLRDRLQREFESRETRRQRERQLQAAQRQNAISTALQLTNIEETSRLRGKAADAKASQDAIQNQFAALRISNERTNIELRRQSNLISAEQADTAQARLVEQKADLGGSPADKALVRDMRERGEDIGSIYDALDAREQAKQIRVKTLKPDVPLNDPRVRGVEAAVKAEGYTAISRFPNELRGPALANLVNSNAVLRNKDFNAKSLELSESMNGLRDFTQLVLQARAQGNTFSIDAEDDPVLQRLKGSLLNIARFAGTEPLAELAARMRPLVGVGIAQRFSQGRLSDRDMVIFANAAVSLSDTTEFINFMEAFQLKGAMKSMWEGVLLLPTAAGMSTPAVRGRIGLNKIFSAAEGRNMQLSDFLIEMRRNGFAPKF